MIPKFPLVCGASMYGNLCLGALRSPVGWTRPHPERDRSYHPHDGQRHEDPCKTSSDNAQSYVNRRLSDEFARHTAGPLIRPTWPGLFGVEPKLPVQRRCGACGDPLGPRITGFDQLIDLGDDLGVFPADLNRVLVVVGPPDADQRDVSASTTRSAVRALLTESYPAGINARGRMVGCGLLSGTGAARCVVGGACGFIV